MEEGPEKRHPSKHSDSRCSDYVTHPPGQTNGSDASLFKDEESRAKNTK